MTALIAELPSTEPETEPDFAALETSRQISPAEGAAWRAVRLLIFEHDPTRAFGDLRRVQAPSGDYHGSAQATTRNTILACPMFQPSNLTAGPIAGARFQLQRSLATHSLG